MSSNHVENNGNDDCCAVQVIFPPNPKSFCEELGESYAVIAITNLLFGLLVFLVILSVIETYYGVSILPEFYTYNPIPVPH